jgi:hypothetical protein
MGVCLRQTDATTVPQRVRLLNFTPARLIYRIPTKIRDFCQHFRGSLRAKMTHACIFARTSNAVP